MKKIINFIIKNRYIILLLLLYIFFFIQMQFVHFYGDDFEVLYPLHNNYTFLNVLNFCLDKMSYFWNEWSGRIIGHFTVSFGLSFFGIQFFRILNPIMIFFLAYLCLKILSLFKKFDFMKYLFFLSLIIIGLNIYISRETLYWAYGGILYIWGFDLTLLTVYFVYKYYLEKKNISIPLFILLSAICFMQTFILEQLSFMLISFLFIMLIINIKNKKNPISIFFLLVVSIIGFIVSSLAPGNVLRTNPLIEELNLYTGFQVSLGKLHGFFNWIFNPKLLGAYISIFALLVSRRYLNILNKENKFIKKLPYIIFISYFIIIIISNLLDINILKLYEDSDSLRLMYEYNYLSKENQFITSISMIIIIIYYLLLTISIFYMSFKVFFKSQKFLFLSLIITYIPSIITSILIRFIGLRYYIFFLVTIILISIYCIIDRRDMLFSSKELLFIGIILPFKYSIPITIIILIIMFISKKIATFINNNCNIIIIILGISILVYNIFVTFFGYIRNDRIYRNNGEILSNSSPNDVFAVDAIPDSDKLYTWHSISMRWDESSKYYGFYLNKFYESYYQVNMDNVYIKTEDGYYVN